MAIQIQQANNGIKEIILNQIERKNYDIEEDALFFLLRMLTLAEYKILDKYQVGSRGAIRRSSGHSQSKPK